MKMLAPIRARHLMTRRYPLANARCRCIAPEVIGIVLDQHFGLRLEAEVAGLT